MIQRKRELELSSIFLRQNPGEAHLTSDELQEMAENSSAPRLFFKMSRYVVNMTGTASYWHKVREDLKATILHVGPPTFFYTFSCADMHWPELHQLFSANHDSNVGRDNVINNPHVVDWFFTERVNSFIKYWLCGCLDAEWNWHRHEYQGRRGSIHAHGVAKLKNDPGLCALTETALKGYLAEKKKTICLHQLVQMILSWN